MGITVLPEIAEEIRGGETVLIEVRSVDERLPAAMWAVRAALTALGDGGADPAGPEGPKYVSTPVPLPSGQLIMVDLGGAPERLTRTIPDLIARQLAGSGLRDAVVGAPRRLRDAYPSTESWGPAARAWLRGPLCRPLGDAPPAPPRWLLDVAHGWLSVQDPPPGELLGVVFSTETPLTWDTLRPVADAVLDAAGAPAVTALATDFSTAVAAATVAGSYRNMIPEASLTTAGAGWGPAQVAAAMRSQRDAIRRSAALLAWAGVSAEPDARRMLLPRWDERLPPGQPATGPRRPAVEQLADVLVPDGCWYQLLSAGHLARLGGDPPGSVRVAGDRAELTVGAPEQWLPGHPDLPAVQAEARRLLAGCLASPDEAFTMTRQRMQDASRRAGGG